MLAIEKAMENTKISRALKDKSITSFRDKINAKLFHRYFVLQNLVPEPPLSPKKLQFSLRQNCIKISATNLI